MSLIQLNMHRVLNLKQELVFMKMAIVEQVCKQLCQFRLQFVLFVIIMILQTHTVLAANFQSLNSIKTAVNDYLELQQNPENNFKISIGTIDNRLRLPSCNHKLNTYFLPGSKNSGNTTVGVSCNSPKKWTFYVPANVKLYKHVAVTSHPMSRGDEVNSATIQFIEKEISSLNSGYFTKNDILIGLIARRSLPTGHVFTPNSIKPPNLVLRGEEVAIIVKSKGFQVRVMGVALMNGIARQKIKVKNKASKIILEAIVTGRGIVSVRM